METDKIIIEAIMIALLCALSPHFFRFMVVLLLTSIVFNLRKGFGL